MRYLALIASVLSFAVSAFSKSSTGSSVLVVFDPKLEKQDYSLFFSGLEKRGYELTFRAPKDVGPQVYEFDEPQFSHVILFTPHTKSYANDLSPQALVQMLESKINLLFITSPTQTPLTTLALEFGISFSPAGTTLTSHFPERPTPHTIVPIPYPKSSSILSFNTSSHPSVLYTGASHTLSPNPLLIPILQAPAESFAADPADSESESGKGNGDASGAEAIVDAIDKAGEGLWAGSQIGLVSGLQTRDNGARATWVGGPEVFSDDYATREVEKGVKSGNYEFVQDIAKWTFQESLVLRIDNTTHHRVGETTPGETYTVNDHVVYSMSISAWNPETAQWIPYSGLTDMQLEFTMLDPHIRTALSPVKGKEGQYEVTFRIPDRHGVFKFVVDYRRKGLTFLRTETVVPVVPYRHDGYPRFLSAAWPYYAGAISTSLGFLLFSAVWLGGESIPSKKKSQ